MEEEDRCPSTGHAILSLFCDTNALMVHHGPRPARPLYFVLILYAWYMGQSLAVVLGQPIERFLSALSVVLDLGPVNAVYHFQRYLRSMFCKIRFPFNGSHNGMAWKCLSPIVSVLYPKQGDTIHVYTTPYHASVGLRWSTLLRRVQCSTPFLKGVHLFAVSKTMPNLRKRCLGWMKRKCRQAGRRTCAHNSKGPGQRAHNNIDVGQESLCGALSLY